MGLARESTVRGMMINVLLKTAGGEKSWRDLDDHSLVILNEIILLHVVKPCHLGRGRITLENHLRMWVVSPLPQAQLPMGKSMFQSSWPCYLGTRIPRHSSGFDWANTQSTEIFFYTDLASCSVTHAIPSASWMSSNGIVAVLADRPNLNQPQSRYEDCSRGITRWGS